MTTAQERPSLPQLVMLPFAAWAAIHAFAAAVQNPLLRAEGLFLAFWVAALVVVLLWLAPRPGREAPIVAVLATAIVWGVHAYSTPGAAVGAMLVLALGVACTRRLARSGWELDLPALCAAAIGLQIVLRPELFLRGPALGQCLFELLALPLAGALAVAALQRVVSHRALLATLLAIVLAGGWSPRLLLWLVGAAAASHLFTPRSRLRPLPLLAWVPLLAWLSAATLLWWREQGHAAFLLALTAAGPLRLGAPRAGARRALQSTAVVTLVAAVAWLVVEGLRTGWPGGVQELAMLALLLPTLAWSALRQPGAMLPLLFVVAVGLLALPTGGGPVGDGPAGGGFVAALPFLAFALPRERALLAVQGTWGAFVAGTALLFGAYPWLRDDPVHDALALFGVQELLVWAPIAAVAAVAAGAATTFLASRSAILRAAPVSLPALVPALLLAAVALGLPADSRSVTSRQLVLHAGEPHWHGELSPATEVGTVVVDSYLSNASRVPAGELIARVSLESEGGESATWDLRAGVDTGEWAARRTDVAARPGLRAPPAWLAWVEPQGRYFAQRYRSTLRADEPVAGATGVSIERTATAEELQLVVTSIEVRP